MEAALPKPSKSGALPFAPNNTKGLPVKPGDTKTVLGVEEPLVETSGSRALTDSLYSLTKLSKLCLQIFSTLAAKMTESEVGVGLVFLSAKVSINC